MMDLVPPCLPIAFNLDYLTSCYYFLYMPLEGHRLKFSNANLMMFVKGTFSSIIGSVTAKKSSGGKPPDTLCCLSDTMQSLIRS